MIIGNPITTGGVGQACDTMRVGVRGSESFLPQLSGLSGFSEATISFDPVQSIAGGAFESMAGILEVSLRDCTSIGDLAFNDCGQLYEFHADNLRYAGDLCFAYNSAPLPINSPYALWPKLESIGNMAFLSRGAAAVSLPAARFLGDEAFGGSTGLERVYLMGSTVCSIGAAPFSGCTSLSAIYVPISLYASYINSPDWSAYSTIIEGI